MITWKWTRKLSWVRKLRRMTNDKLQEKRKKKPDFLSFPVSGTLFLSPLRWSWSSYVMPPSPWEASFDYFIDCQKLTCWTENRGIREACTEACIESRISPWLYATVIEDNLVHRASSLQHVLLLLLNETWRQVKLPQNPPVSRKFYILFSRFSQFRFSRTKFTSLRVNCRLFGTNCPLVTVTMSWLRRFHLRQLRLLTRNLVSAEVTEMADSARRRLKQLPQNKI